MQLITLFFSGALAQNILLTNNQGQKNTVSGTGCFGLGNGPYTGFNTNDNVVGEFFSQSNCQGSIIATGKRNNLWFGPVNAQSIRVSQDKASNPNAPSYYRGYDDWYPTRDHRDRYMNSPSEYHHENEYPSRDHRDRYMNSYSEYHRENEYPDRDHRDRYMNSYSEYHRQNGYPRYDRDDYH